jgi:hypothetical protein
MINRIRITAIGVLAALAVTACGSSGGNDQPLLTSVTQPGTVESVGFGSPEVLIENLIAAIERGDAPTLESALPPESWELFGASLLDGFVPRPGDPPCPEVTGTTARCYVFESEFPRVLEVEAESGEGGWIVTRAVIESTN